MSTSNWARRLAAASLLAAAAAPALAGPTVVVDFEPGFAMLGNGDTYTQGGINVTAVGAGAVIDPSFCDPTAEYCAVGNSTSFLSAQNDTEIDLSVGPGYLFTLGSFTAAFLPSPLIPLVGAQIKLKLDGVSQAGAAVSTTVDLLEDGFSGNFLFGQYDASSLGLLRSLHFSVCLDDGTQCGPFLFANDAQFALDDLSVAVPEPGVAGLVALSLAALALARRRTRC